jgi:hypothetical protein
MDRYAFLMVAMSAYDAKTLLGFPSDSNPSPDEVRRAQRKLTLENHPDRGGDPEKLVEINAAADILLWKARPTYERAPSSQPAQPSTGAPGWSAPKRNEVTFNEAKSKAGVPDADWLFITDRQKGSGGWSSDESSLSDRAWVAYGKTASNHVFVGMSHYTREDYYVGGGNNTDVWSIKVLEYPIRGAEGQTPSWLYGHVIDALKAVDFGGRFNSKVYDLSGKNWRFDDKFPTSGSALSIKHWLVGSGQVSGDDPAVVNRKHVVEIEHSSTRDYGNGIQAEHYPEPPARWNTWDGKYHGDYHKLTLIVDGAPYDLKEAEVKAFLGLKIGGKRALNAIYGDYTHGGKKVLTRLKYAKPLLQWFAENAAGMPQRSRDALVQAAAQAKG